MIQKRVCTGYELNPDRRALHFQDFIDSSYPSEQAHNAFFWAARQVHHASAIGKWATRRETIL